jgi:thymidylate kinase
MKLIHIIVEGPDGAGKSTIVEHLVNNLPNSISFSIGKVNELYPGLYNLFQFLMPDDINVMFELKKHPTLEKSLHLYRHSLTIAKITQLVKDMFSKNVDTVYLIQDRSWISSVVYNDIDKELAYRHFLSLVNDMLNNIDDSRANIDYYLEYLYVYTSPEELDERKKARGTSDIYEETTNSVNLLEKYAITLNWLRHNAVRENILHYENSDGKSIDPILINHYKQV